MASAVVGRLPRPVGVRRADFPVARWSAAKVRMAAALWAAVRASAARALARAGFPVVVGWPENPAESSAAVLSSRGVRAAVLSRPAAPVWFGAMVRVAARVRSDRRDAERTLLRAPVQAPRRDEGGERPDYLTEDEETWQQGGRRVVPPVID